MENSAKVRRLGKAFLKFMRSNFHTLSWKTLAEHCKDILGTSSHTTLRALFGGNGDPSNLNKEGGTIPSGHYEKQLKVIACLNEFYNPKIEVYENGEPKYNEEGNLCFCHVPNEPEGILGSAIVAEKKAKRKSTNAKYADEYQVYYWRHGDKLGKGKISLHFESEKASYTIFYQEDKKNDITIEGSFTENIGIFTLWLYDKENKESNPQTQISFTNNSGSFKDCYVGTFCTSHRGGSNFPVAGVMLLFTKEAMDKVKDTTLIEQYATHFLYRQKFEITNTGFNIGVQNNAITIKGNSPTDIALNKNFSVVKYKGIYQGVFVNPKLKSYESFILKIRATAEVEILVKRYSETFKGVATIFNEISLIISYDFIDIQDFRMRLCFDIHRLYFRNDVKFQMLFGLMNGIEKASSSVMSSTVVMKQIDKDEKDILLFKDSLVVKDLEIENELKESLQLLDKEKLTNFFFGKQLVDFTSIGLLNSFNEGKQN